MDDLKKNKDLNSELNIVFQYLRKLGVSQEDAEDAVQEAAYRYLLYFDSIKTSKIRSWLIRVALNYFYDQCRKNGRYMLNINEENLKIDNEELPEMIILNKERNKELGRAVSQLKPLFQELLLLKYQSGLTYEEISVLLGVSISSIKTNLFRARKKLEKMYKEVTHER
ncbi:RNA polymerase sigma factor [Neobacillus mesonae]|uniref:RNA polymerase sigma factor n=1 Tax=Neobacillus mesonae TaxID=1193713 RepID=UPI0020417841|nr:RNA polymerase sigma factor [Neobacillus mesonae]MCM3570267.1 RNA polymerase sigma factor [Neobacillus mesonae]